MKPPRFESCWGNAAVMCSQTQVPNVFEAVTPANTREATQIDALGPRFAIPEGPAGLHFWSLIAISVATGELLTTDQSIVYQRRMGLFFALSNC